jgi:hypothetical protein
MIWEGDGVPDYTKQLDEIVRLLSRPNISPLLLAGAAALLGVIFGAIGRAIEQWIEGRRRRSRMRRVLYQDIAGMFFEVNVINTNGGGWAADRVRDDAFGRLVGDLDFEAEDHFKSNRDTFAQLKERPAVKHIYALFHRIKDEGPATMDRNCGTIPRTLGKYISDGSLKRRYFLRAIPKQQARFLIERCTEDYSESIRQAKQYRTQDE